MSPTVTVVIPLYNAESYLAAAIESVQAQTYRSWEIVVVDDGSTDQSADIAQSYKDIRYLCQENAGPSAARNLAMNSTEGEIIAFLDADDLWLPEKLELQVACLLGNPQIDVCLAHYRNFLEDGQECPPWISQESLSETGEPPFSPVTIAFRRSVLETAGLMDESYPVGGDVEWLTRIRDSGVQVMALDQVLTLRRIHDKNLGHRVKDNNFAKMKILKARIDRKKKAAQN